MNVVKNKNHVANVNVANALKAHVDVLCVSCDENVIQLVLWIVDCGCSKHMTGNLKLLRNFMEKFMGTVCFGNDHFVAITGRLCSGKPYDLSPASSPVYLMSKATSAKSWLWHHRFSHLNFATINHLTKQDLVDGLPKFKYDKDHLCPTFSDDIDDESIQEDTAELDGNTSINLLCSPKLEEAESSSTNQDPSNMHEFYQQLR
ncbi:copia protein [Tanacetum coccineum]